jgi:hypothetical protein
VHAARPQRIDCHIGTNSVGRQQQGAGRVRQVKAIDTGGQAPRHKTQRSHLRRAAGGVGERLFKVAPGLLRHRQRARDQQGQHRRHQQPGPGQPAAQRREYLHVTHGAILCARAATGERGDNDRSVKPRRKPP